VKVEELAAADLPLGGVRVVECAGTVGGAYVGRLLCDLGAEVVKVESPDGDGLRHRGPWCDDHAGSRWSAAAASYHAGKRSIVVAPDAAGREVLSALLAHADVVVRNPGPGAPEISDDLIAAVDAVNPGLIVADLTAYGRSGPRGDVADPDLVTSARSGILSLTSTVGSASTYLGPPSPLRYVGEASWVFGACHTAVAVLGALLGRLRHGRGDHLDTSAMESLVAVLATAVPTYTYTGRVPTHDAPKIVRPWAIYELADGTVSIQCTEDAQWRALAGVLGRQDWLGRDDWATTDGRVADADALEAAVAAELRQRRSADVLAATHAAGVPATVVQTNAEVLAWPQLVERGFFARARVGTGATTVTVPRAPMRFDRHVLPRVPLAPALGADRGVLDEWCAGPRAGVVPTDPDDVRSPPLAGTRIADLTWVWAGPFATMQLAFLGADVVKVESHTRVDVVRRLGPYADDVVGIDRTGYFHQYNQGKRSTDLDLTTADGRATFEALLASSDLVVDNMRAGALARMGYDEAHLRAVNTDIIAATLTGFGDEGPDRDRTAYGAIINCLSGIAAITGHPGGGPVDLQLSLADPCSGLHAAVGLLAALYRRRTTGWAGRVDITMVEAWIAAFPWGVLAEAAGEMPTAVGNRDVQWCPNVIAPCRGADEWVAVAVGDDATWGRLAAVIGRPDLATDERFATAAARQGNVDGAEQVLIGWTIGLDAAVAADTLRAGGVPAARVARLDDVLADEQLDAHQFFTAMDHPIVGRRSLAGAPWRSRNAPVGPSRPAPLLGEHTTEVRAELGRTAPPAQPVIGPPSQVGTGTP
jgi:crotonobetainyl-CoA:carnitine CoA-transferase CaiB-like acyl-CoA transferase